METNTNHGDAAGSLCTDDGSGCCGGCGVEMSVCLVCGGIGYCRSGCAQIDGESLTADTITDDHIHALRVESSAMGDALQVKLCDHALATQEELTNEDGSPDMTATSVAMARESCAKAINAARAQED